MAGRFEPQAARLARAQVVRHIAIESAPHSPYNEKGSD